MAPPLTKPRAPKPHHLVKTAPRIVQQLVNAQPHPARIREKRGDIAKEDPFMGENRQSCGYNRRQPCGAPLQGRGEKQTATADQRAATRPGERQARTDPCAITRRKKRSAATA